MALSSRIVLFSILLIAACDEPTYSDRGVEVTATVNRQTFYAGDTAHITISASNEGSETVVLNAKQCPFHFQVINAQGSVVGPGARECSMEAYLRDVAPGETLVQQYRWALDGNGGIQVPAGEYRIRGWAYGAQNLRARSGDVTITIGKQN